MNIQVLVAAMEQNDHSLLQKMNIQSDAIVGNQCEYNNVESFDYKGHSVIYLNFKERGVGLNRNNALMRATGDICLFADDDMVYVDHYCEIVENAFKNLPEADVILFNLIENPIERYVIKQTHRISYYNFLRFGAARIAVRLKKIRREGIYFNQCFGGGCEFQHGEDNIFLADCLKKKLKIYAVPKYIARLNNDRQSSWRTGYDYKYLSDQGELYKTISRPFWKVLCIQDAIRHRNVYLMDFKNVYLAMTKKRGNSN